MISVALAVLNEEQSLDRCLKSVEKLADEIVVVDGGSTDRTIKIAKKYHARIIQTTNPAMFHINKQKALNAAKGEWILALDADEAVSPLLAQEIRDVVAGKTHVQLSAKKQRLFQRHQQRIEARDGAVGTEHGEITAYFVPRLNFYLGGWLKHGGVYPDGVIRLLKKGKAHFPCKSVHEQLAVDGKVAWLQNDLLHYADPTFGRYLMRANRYTSLTADRMLADHVSTSVLSILHYMIFKPCATFLSLYIRHKGVLDGFPGFVWALFSGLHYPLAFMKYWEMKHAET